MLLEAIKPHGYRGKPRKRGDIYEAKEKDARALISARISRCADRQLDNWRESKPVSLEGPEPVAIPVPTNRIIKLRYKHREMVPEK